jgi:cation diffusion facilitator family transporter
MRGILFMKNMDRKSRVALLSIASNTTLITLKLIAGILSGSVGIISETIHSGMDLIASIVAFFSVRLSSKPADKEHPFGHGKLENISGLAEGVLIFVAAGMIISEAVKKLLHPVELEQAYVAIGVMLFAGFFNFLVSSKLRKVAKEEDSQALEADSLHLLTDTYTSLGVGVGIVLVKVTNLAILDPIVAILVALFIIKEAWNLSKGAFDYLIDVKLSDQEEAEIVKIIEEHKDMFVDYHKLKTRKSGNKKHIDFHLTLDPKLTVMEAHDIVGHLKKDMAQSLRNSRVSIHIDPYQVKNESEDDSEDESN